MYINLMYVMKSYNDMFRLKLFTIYEKYLKSEGLYLL